MFLELKLRVKNLFTLEFGQVRHVYRHFDFDIPSISAQVLCYVELPRQSHVRTLMKKTGSVLKASLFCFASDFAQKAECFRIVLSNSNHKSSKPYRLNKNTLLIFADDVFNTSDNNLIIFKNGQSY